MMKYKDALNLAKIIMQKHPNYILCGSVGLIFQGVMSERDVHDLDFVCPKETLPKLHLYGGDDRYVIKNEGYDCLKVTGCGNDSFYYNLFVFDNTSEVEYSEIDGIKIQNAVQMLKYKQQYNRDKDRKDLQPWAPFGGVNPNIGDDDEIPF